MTSVATTARTISATWEPVNLRDAKKHLEIPDAATAHDGILSTLIEAAREIVEDDTGLWLPTSTGVLNFDEWPETYIELPVRPATSVTSIQYVDTAGSTQTWSSANYTIDANHVQPLIYYGYNVSLPSIRSVENAVIVTWVGGYATQADVPEKIKQMVLIKMAQLFIDREGMENVRANPRGNPWEFESAYQSMVRRYQRATYP